jgi:hypothetical protein
MAPVLAVADIAVLESDVFSQILRVQWRSVAIERGPAGAGDRLADPAADHRFRHAQSPPGGVETPCLDDGNQGLDMRGMIFHANFDDRMRSILFMKNLAMAGGFLLLGAGGAGRWSLHVRNHASRS